MPTLFIDRKGSIVRHKDGRLIVEKPDEARADFPMQMLDRVIIRSGCQADCAALAALGRRGIPVAIVGGRSEADTVLVSAMARDGLRRLAQVRAYSQADQRKRLGLLIVRSKIRRQRVLLECERGGTAEFALRKGIQALTEILGRCGEWKTTAELLGAEGAGARAYFQAFQELFAPALGFTGRNRRPPRDPVNACLSLGYTLMHANLTGDLATEGFDPFLGFLHEPAAGRASLACDFVELLRTSTDRMVLGLFRRRSLRREHFRMSESRCLLGKTGRRIFYEAWDGEWNRGAPWRLATMRKLAQWLDRAEA